MSGVDKIKISNLGNSENYFGDFIKTPQTYSNQTNNSSVETVNFFDTNNTAERNKTIYTNSVISKLENNLDANTGAYSLFGNSFWTNSFDDNWLNNGIPIIKTNVKTVNDTLERTCATITVGTFSLVEGLLNFGEAIVDFLALSGTISRSIVTGLYDGYQAINGLITGKEWHSVTKEMWNDTQAFISNKYVSGWFDTFYNTGFGSYLRDTSYSFDTVRSVGNGVGYVAGIVILTIATFGVGSVVSTGGTVSVSSATAVTNAAAMSTTATLAGIGKGTEDAWNNGADIVEGVVAGGLYGAWEGFQFFIGSKIGGFNKFSSKGVNVLSRIILDGLDGGLEGFVQPLIKTTYKDESYIGAFKSYGGWQNVLTNAVIGSISSSIGEGFDLAKHFASNFEQDIKYIDTNAQVVTSDSSFITTLDKNIKTGISEIDNLVDCMHKNGLTDDYIKNALPDLKKYYDLKDKVKTFDGSSKEVSALMKEYFGDVSNKISFMFLGGKQIDEIISHLSDDEIIDFTDFLNNTKQGKFISNLTFDEREWISNYTGSSYQQINNALRLENGLYSNAIENIDSAIKKFGGLDTNMRLYRGDKVTPFTQNYPELFEGIDINDLDSVYASLKTLEGRKLTDKGYFSTSPGYNTSFAVDEDCPIVYEILAPEGTEGAYVNSISGNSGECEVLLARNTEMRLIEVQPPKIDINGNLKIVLKCIVTN